MKKQKDCEGDFPGANIIGAIIEYDIWKKWFQHNFRKSLEKEETCDFSLLVCGGGGANQLGQSPNFFRKSEMG